MAKFIKPEAWDKARALFEAGKSLRDIEQQTKIPKGTIEYRAKKEDWQKGCLGQLITDKSSVDAKFQSLNQTQKTVVLNEVERLNKLKEFFSDKAIEVSNVALKSLERNPSTKAAFETMQTLEKGMKVSGVVPFYPNQKKASENNNENLDPLLAAREYYGLSDALHDAAKIIENT